MFGGRSQHTRDDHAVGGADLQQAGLVEKLPADLPLKFVP
jgi:hypothetical protein